MTLEREQKKKLVNKFDLALKMSEQESIYIFYIEPNPCTRSTHSLRST